MVNELRFAIIEDGIVSNIAIASSALEPNWVLCEDARIGDTYADGQFTKPEPDVAAQWAVVRTDRNRRLMDCDWTQLADAPLTDEQRIECGAYRQALRDITAQADPFDIVWPDLPQLNGL